jgi:ribonuclease HII
MKITQIAGVDEAGRGPLAGPVAVGVVLVGADAYATIRKRFAHLRGRDSKKWTETEREKRYAEIMQAKREGLVTYAVAQIGTRTIDEKGISSAIRSGVARGLVRAGAVPSGTRVLLDGGLRAPKSYVNQQTIIKGDEKEIIIAMASIVAKVTRDRTMRRLAKQYPVYGFDIHKGYGTKAHYTAIECRGICPEHRRTFLKKILEL